MIFLLKKTVTGSIFIEIKINFKWVLIQIFDKNKCLVAGFWVLKHVCMCIQINKHMCVCTYIFLLMLSQIYKTMILLNKTSSIYFSSYMTEHMKEQCL